MDLAADRGDVVLAMRLEADVLQRNDLVIAVRLFEGALQQRYRVLVKAAEELLVGADDALRGAEEALAFRIAPAQRINLRTASSASSRVGRRTAVGRRERGLGRKPAE
jgi:hypothetical protein